MSDSANRVEFKIVEGSEDLLLLVNGKCGVPEEAVDDRERDGNELHRFTMGFHRLSQAVPGFPVPHGALDIIRRCIPFVMGDCEGEEHDEEAIWLLQDIDEILEEAGL